MSPEITAGLLAAHLLGRARDPDVADRLLTAAGTAEPAAAAPAPPSVRPTALSQAATAGPTQARLAATLSTDPQLLEHLLSRCRAHLPTAPDARSWIDVLFAAMENPHLPETAFTDTLTWVCALARDEDPDVRDWAEVRLSRLARTHRALPLLPMILSVPSSDLRQFVQRSLPELVAAHPDTATIAAAVQLAAHLDEADPDLVGHLARSLHLHHGSDVLDELFTHLERATAHPTPAAWVQPLVEAGATLPYDGGRRHAESLLRSSHALLPAGAAWLNQWASRTSAAVVASVVRDCREFRGLLPDHDLAVLVDSTSQPLRFLAIDLIDKLDRDLEPGQLDRLVEDAASFASIDPEDRFSWDVRPDHLVRRLLNAPRLSHQLAAEQMSRLLSLLDARQGALSGPEIGTAPALAGLPADAAARALAFLPAVAFTNWCSGASTLPRTVTQLERALALPAPWGSPLHAAIPLTVGGTLAAHAPRGGYRSHSHENDLDDLDVVALNDRAGVPLIVEALYEAAGGHCSWSNLELLHHLLEQQCGHNPDAWLACCQLIEAMPQASLTELVDSAAALFATPASSAD